MAKASAIEWTEVTWNPTSGSPHAATTAMRSLPNGKVGG